MYLQKLETHARTACERTSDFRANAVEKLPKVEWVVGGCEQGVTTHGLCEGLVDDCPGQVLQYSVSSVIDALSQGQS
jgi:hypothetical protein